MKNRRLICFLAALVLALSCLASASALSSSTLSIGSRGEEVRKLQQALIDLGYLREKPTGSSASRHTRPSAISRPPES